MLQGVILVATPPHHSVPPPLTPSPSPPPALLMVFVVEAGPLRGDGGDDNEDGRESYVLLTIFLLCCSCAVMTVAWYLHLKFEHWSIRQAIVYSWCIASLEYSLMIPANRIGALQAGMSPATLRGIAELAILVSFLLFNRLVLKQAVLWNHLVGFSIAFIGVLVVLSVDGGSLITDGRVVNHSFARNAPPTAASVNACNAEVVPDSLELFRRAFPPDTDGGKWASIFMTKQNDGMDPKLGGYPTPLDVGYPFEYPAPFFGQPGAGTINHCPIDAPSNVDVSSCPVVTTSGDDDLEGPGHIPAIAATEALLYAHRACEPLLQRWFASSCRISAADLLTAVRKVYPRELFSSLDAYPTPGTPGAYSMRSLDWPSPQGSPHFCDVDYRAIGMWVDYCPCALC